MHFTRFGKRYTPPPNIGPNATHGIRATYARGCRCDLCRDAWRIVRGDKERARRRIRRLEEARQLLREAGEL